MINQALFDVVKNQLAIGVSEGEVREFLRRRGTSDPEIQELFEVLGSSSVTIQEIPVSSVNSEQAPSALRQAQDETSSGQAPSVPEQAAPIVAPQIIEPDPIPAVIQEQASSISDQVPSASQEQTPSAPIQSEAHGIVRDIPPLQPSAPFAPVVPDQFAEPAKAVSDTSPVDAGTSMTADFSAIPTIPAITFAAQEPLVPGRKKTFIFVGGGVVAAIVLLFGGYLVYSSYFVSPEKVLDTMISRLRDVRSGEFSVDITVVTNSMSELAATSTAANPFLKAFAVEGPVTMTLHASGTVDVLNEQKPKFAITFSSTMDKWAMGDFALGAEYRNIDRMNYLKINAVPDLGFFSLSFLKNQWFDVSDTDAKKQLGTASSSSSNSIIPSVSQTQRDQLVAAWDTYRFLTVASVLNSEDVDGVSTRHYKLAFDKTMFMKWDAETSRIANKTGATATTASGQENLDLITFNELEIWIGKRDGLPHKLLVHVSAKDKKDQNKISEVTLVMAGNKFNTPLDVAIPQGTKSIEEAMQGIFGQMLGGGGDQKAIPATLKDRNDQRKRDVAAIADAIKKNMGANGGTFVCAAGPLPTMATFMGAAGFGMSGYAIESCLVPAYLKTMPRDPSKGSLTMSGYSVLYNAKTKKVTVRAPYTEGNVMISVTK